MKYPDYTLRGEDVYRKGKKQHPYIFVNTGDLKTNLKFEDFKEELRKENNILTVDSFIDSIGDFLPDPGYEVWGDIEDFPGYEVSSYCNFKKNGKEFKPYFIRTNKENGNDYYSVRIEGKSKMLWTLVFKIFNPKPYIKNIKITYKDGDITNCRYDNMIAENINRYENSLTEKTNVYKEALEHLINYNNDLKEKYKELERELNSYKNKIDVFK